MSIAVSKQSLNLKTTEFTGGEVMASQREHLIRLHEMLAKRFDAEELRTLCFLLGLDYDDLRGEGKLAKARELVALLERHGRIAELVATGKQLRPDPAWDVDNAAIPAPTRRCGLEDLYARYERGLAQLVELLGRNHPRYQDALVYQHQIQENIEHACRHGDTADLLADRGRIVEQLNKLSSETIGASFNELTGIPLRGDPSALPRPTAPPPNTPPPAQHGAGVTFQGSVQGRDFVFGNQINNNTANFYSPVGQVYDGGDTHAMDAAAQTPAPLHMLLEALKLQVSAHAPPALTDEGQRQVVQLEEAIGIPSPALMGSVLDWFRASLPFQAHAVEAIILHAAVAHKIMSADREAVAEFRRRFGDLSI